MNPTKLLALLLLSCISLLSNASPIISDTTVVEFTDKGVKKRVTVLTDGFKDFKIPRILNIDNLLKEIGVDSTERKKAVVLIETGEADKDTILVVSRDGRKIKIVAKNPFPNSVSKGDTTQPDTENRWDSGEERAATTKDNNESEDEDDDDIERLGKKRFFSKSDFGIYLGLNNWANNNPSSPFQETELRTGKSRYVALSFRKNATLVNSEQVDIALSLGPEIAWYNFMLKNDFVVTKPSSQVQFVDSGENLSKSKLVMPYLNFPVILNFGFEKSQFQIGFGGYVGYRIGGYTKTKDNDGNKNRYKDNFGMNDLSYGLTGELGKRRGLKLFVRYDLTPTFKENQIYANQLKAWSVGVRI